MTAPSTAISGAKTVSLYVVAETREANMKKRKSIMLAVSGANERKKLLCLSKSTVTNVDGASQTPRKRSKKPKLCWEDGGNCVFSKTGWLVLMNSCKQVQGRQKSRKSQLMSHVVHRDFLSHVEHGLSLSPTYRDCLILIADHGVQPRPRRDRLSNPR